MTISSNTVPVSIAKVDVSGINTKLAAAFDPSLRRASLCGALASYLVYAGVAVAAAAQVALPPAQPMVRTLVLPQAFTGTFQQTVQQQVRDQLQKAQVEARNRQGVSNNSRLPYANNLPMQNQIDQADAAQQNSERARQQEIINRYEDTPVPLGGAIVPQRAVTTPAPQRPASGG